MASKTKDIAQPEPRKPADIAINPPPPLAPGPQTGSGSITPVWPKRKLEF
jgi:hypothetical protein